MYLGGTLIRMSCLLADGVCEKTEEENTMELCLSGCEYPPQLCFQVVQSSVVFWAPLTGSKTATHYVSTNDLDTQM